MAQRLPIVFPLMVTESMGCARGDPLPTAMLSSHGSSMPREATRLRKSAAVLSDGIRVSFKTSAIESVLTVVLLFLPQRAWRKIFYSSGELVQCFRCCINQKSSAVVVTRPRLGHFVTA